MYTFALISLHVMLLVATVMVLYFQDWKGILKSAVGYLTNPTDMMTRKYSAQKLSPEDYADYRKEYTTNAFPYSCVMNCQWVVDSEGNRLFVDNWGTEIH